MFIFEASFNPSNLSEKTLVVFSGQMEGDDSDYGAIFEAELSKYPVAPDKIIFIFPGYILSEVKNLLGSESRFYRNLTRYGARTEIFVYSFDGFSKLTSIPFERPLDDDASCLDSLREKIVSSGIRYLAASRRNQVIQKAPPGTIFIKPSSEEFEEFIKTAELTVGYSQNQFLAFCVLSRRPKDRIVKHIWIDTSGISTIIEALSYYLYKFSEENCKPVKYHSYNSYSNFLKCKPDYSGNVWMIISASTSNNLGKKAAQEWRLCDDQVLTILSYKDSMPGEVGDKVLANICSLSDAQQELRKTGTAIGVNVHGENFTAQVKEPNRVMIKAIHKPSEIENSIFPFHYLNIFHCNRVDQHRHCRDVYIDLSKLLSDDPDKKIKKWIKTLLSWYLPANLSWVVCDKNCHASLQLYSLFCETLEGLSLKPSYTHIDISDAETKVSGNGAVVILSPVISNGHSLLRLNRNLRISKHEGNRIFICPFVVASSKNSYLSMVNTLTYGPDNQKYEFYCLHRIHIGSKNEGNSWSDELSLIENFTTEFWKKRALKLSLQSEGLVSDIGLPAAPSLKKLSFTQDFAFWSKKYDPEKVNFSSVYMTIAAVLQSLREKKYADFDTDSLAGSVYQHSVIDPENFMRFDDPLLQSCLWRSAKYKELDYSSSPEMCVAFTTFLSRLLKSYSEGGENSALDILMGIAIKKIELTKRALIELISEAKCLLTKNEAAMELIVYIDTYLLLNVSGPSVKEEQII